MKPTKYALLFGFNYPESGCPLSGCANDVNLAAKNLLGFNYQPQNIFIINEETIKLDIHPYPDYNGVLKIIDDVVALMKPGDQLYFHFSGHGGQVYDTSGDEVDGLDECIFACNLDKIVDDDLKKHLVDSLPAGSRLVAVLDCCHSGSGLDLPFCRTIKGGRTHIPRSTPVPKPKSFTGATGAKGSKEVKDAKAFCISACVDSSTAADTSFQRIPQGALSHYFWDTINQRKKMSWAVLTNIISEKTKGFGQTAQLSMTHQEGQEDFVNI